MANGILMSLVIAKLRQRKSWRLRSLISPEWNHINCLMIMVCSYPNKASGEFLTESHEHQSWSRSSSLQGWWHKPGRVCFKEALKVTVLTWRNSTGDKVTGKCFDFLHSLIFHSAKHTNHRWGGHRKATCHRHYSKTPAEIISQKIFNWNI